MRQKVSVRSRTVLRPNSLEFVKVDFTNATGKVNRYLVEGRSQNNTSETVTAIYRADETQAKVAMVNYSPYPVTVYKGETIGSFTELALEIQEDDDHQASQETVNKVEKEDRLEKLLEDLNIHNNKVLNENPGIKKKLIKLLDKHIDTFSSAETSYGHTDLIEFDIKLLPDSEPVASRCRPLNPAQEADLKKQLDLWEKEGIIEKAPKHSAWASPLVPALKKDGTIRWAVDYRKLNAKTVPDRFPLPSIETNLEKLQGSNIYSALDASGAYHTIPVSKKSRSLLTFISPLGLWSMKKMPFGARNSGAVYSRYMDLIISKINSPHILAYLDDIIVHSSTLNQQLEHLELALDAHRDAGLRLKASKTFLFQESVDYLGYHVSKEGISMIPRYVEKVINWPTPTTTKQLATFVGFCGYYRSFIKDFSQLTNEMNSAKKEKELDWTPVMDKKFKELKKKFNERPIRAFPDYMSDEPFILSTDFSATNLAGVLSQKQEGRERMIATCGRKTTSYERNYSSTKGELSAVIFSVRRFEHVLRFKKFILLTDNSALVWLKTMKNPRGITFRWLSELESYDFEVRHKPGKKNIPADCLSRADHPSHMDKPTEDEEKETSEYVYDITELDLEHDSIVDNEGRISTVSEVIEEMDLSSQEIRKAQDEDDVLRIVKQWVKDNRRPSKKDLAGQKEQTHSYAKYFSYLTLIDGILYQTARQGILTEKKMKRLVIPKSKYEAIFYWSHAHELSGHFGETATIARATSRFWWPGITPYLRTQVGLCQTCLSKTQRADPKRTGYRPHMKGYVGETLYLDLIGPLPATRAGHKYALTIEDGYSRFVTALPLVNKNAETVADALYNGYVSIHGAPVSLFSDNGKEFVNKIQRELAQKFMIKHHFTAPYSPASNMVERFHRTLNQLFRTNEMRDNTEWSRYLPAATLAYNTKVHSSTGLSPYYVQFGREARLPVDIICPSPEQRDHTLPEMVKMTIQNFERMYEFIRKNSNAVIRRNAKGYTGEMMDLKLGTEVWYLTPLRSVSGKPSKITDQWVGPYIVEKVEDNIAEIRAKDHEGRVIRTHVTRLVPCNKTRMFRGERRMPVDAEIDPGDSDAEEITAPEGENPVVLVHVPDKDKVEIVKRKRGRPKKIIPLPPVYDEWGEKEPHQEDTPPSPPHTVREDNINHNRKEKSSPHRMEEDDSVNESPQQSDNGETNEEEMPLRSPPLQTPPAGPSRARGKRARDSPQEVSPPTAALTRRVSKRSRPQTGEDSSQQEFYTPSDRPVRRSKRLQPWRRYVEDSTSDEDMPAVKALDSDSEDAVTVAVERGSLMPTKGTPMSACYDLQSAKKINIPGKSTAKVDLRLRVAIPAGFMMLLLGRSGLSLKNISLRGGVIDADFRSSIQAILFNGNEEDFLINKGQRVCQALLLPTLNVDWKEVDHLPPPPTQHSGFGSTGQ